MSLDPDSLTPCCSCSKSYHPFLRSRLFEGNVSDTCLLQVNLLLRFSQIKTNRLISPIYFEAFQKAEVLVMGKEILL